VVVVVDVVVVVVVVVVGVIEVVAAATAVVTIVVVEVVVPATAGLTRLNVLVYDWLHTSMQNNRRVDEPLVQSWLCLQWCS